MHISDLTDYFSDLSVDASTVVSQGKESAEQCTTAIIKSQLEAYILDKASLLELDISAEVLLDDSQPPSPKNVKIVGKASPYAKQRMLQIISDELGIPKENISWT
jgi:hypothetical protein